MKKKYLLATGGTGGHITPALAVAEKLGSNCIILTDQRTKLINYRLGFIQEKVELTEEKKEEQEKTKIIIQYLPIHSSKNIIKFLLSLIPSLFKAIKIIEENKISGIIAFGGYPTIPVLIAAILTRTPFILHEANTIIGRTNRFFLKFASKMTAGLPFRNYYNKTNNINDNNKSSNKKLNEKKYILTGNPVASEIKPCPYPAPDTSEEGLRAITILVFGGSQGAEIFTKEIPKILIEFNSRLKLIANGEDFNVAETLNKQEESEVGQYKDRHIVTKQVGESSKKPEAIKGLKELKEIKGINIIQQCKKESIAVLQSFYKKHSIKCEINSFFSDLPEKIRKAHLVICRAGALSITEILIIGRPSILIPYPFARDNHQLFNAQYVCEGGSLRSIEPETKKEEMAVLLEQKDLTAENLIFSINKILNNIDYFLENIGKFSYKNPTEELIKIIKETF